MDEGRKVRRSRRRRRRRSRIWRNKAEGRQVERKRTGGIGAAERSKKWRKRVYSLGGS